jgi:hypothetical protein
MSIHFIRSLLVTMMFLACTGLTPARSAARYGVDILRLTRDWAGTKQGQVSAPKELMAHKCLKISQMRAAALLKRRAGDSNPQPLSGHLISSQAAGQFAYPPNRITNLYVLCGVGKLNRRAVFPVAAVSQRARSNR